MITGDIIIKVYVTAENNYQLKHTAYQEYRLRGNYEYYNIFAPTFKKFYASDGYSFMPSFKKSLCPHESSNWFNLTSSQILQFNCTLMN